MAQVAWWLGRSSSADPEFIGLCALCVPTGSCQLRCMAASFVYIRGSNCAKGDLLRADTQLRVGAQLFFFSDRRSLKQQTSSGAA